MTETELPAPDAPITSTPDDPRIENLQAIIDNKLAYIRNLEFAIATIVSELLDEADGRDWCAEYNTFVERVNKLLPTGVPKLRYFKKDWNIRFSVTMTENQVSALEGWIDELLDGQGIGNSSSFNYEED